MGGAPQGGMYQPSPKMGGTPQGGMYQPPLKKGGAPPGGTIFSSVAGKGCTIFCRLGKGVALLLWDGGFPGERDPMG